MGVVSRLVAAVAIVSDLSLVAEIALTEVPLLSIHPLAATVGIHTEGKVLLVGTATVHN